MKDLLESRTKISRREKRRKFEEQSRNYNSQLIGVAERKRKVKKVIKRKI